MAPENDVPPPTRFEFINSDDVDAKKRIRKHAMAEFRRQRRCRVSFPSKQTLQVTASGAEWKKEEESGVGTYRNVPGYVPLRPKEENSRYSHRRYEIPSENSFGQDSRDRSRPRLGVSAWDANTMGLPKTTNQPLVRQPSPQQILGSARTDPFSSYPVKIEGKLGHEVLDHFLRGMPFKEFDVEEGSELNPPRHIAFTGSVSWPAAFHALLATGAIHLNSIRRINPTFIVYHLLESLRLLQEGLNRPQAKETMKEQIGAIAALASAEDFRGDTMNCKIHLIGLKNLLRAQGGIGFLNDVQKVQMLVVFIAGSCDASYLPASNNRGHTAAETREIGDHLSHFRDFFRRIQEARLYTPIGPATIRASLIETSFVHNRPIQHLLLKENGPLHTLLGTNKEDNNRGGGGLGYLGIHRIACLFYVCAAILDYQNEDGSPDTESSEKYLQQMYNTFLGNELDRRPNMRLFLFSLIRSKERHAVRLENPTRAWHLVRFMQVSKCLNPETIMGVGETLLNFLMMTDGANGLDGRKSLDIAGDDFCTVESQVWNRLTFM